MINGKAQHRCYYYCGNGVYCQRNKYTLIHGLALMGLKLKKYIELKV